MSSEGKHSQNEDGDRRSLNVASPNAIDGCQVRSFARLHHPASSRRVKVEAVDECKMKPQLKERIAYTMALRGSGSCPSLSSRIRTLSSSTEVLWLFPEP
jgi:hypothetical protein